MEALLLLLPFLNLIVMSGIKWLFSTSFKDAATRNARLRILLILISFAGVIANTALNGQIVEASVVGEFLVSLVTTFGVAFASHLSYKAVKSA